MQLLLGQFFSTQQGGVDKRESVAATVLLGDVRGNCRLKLIGGDGLAGQYYSHKLRPRLLLVNACD